MDYTANEESTDRGRDTEGFGCERVTRYPEVIPGLAPSVDDRWDYRPLACRRGPRKPVSEIAVF